MKKLEKFLFYLFIFSIPFQIRKVLFSFPASSAGGSLDEFMEWNSVFLYFTDLLLIAIFILWLARLICVRPSLTHIRKVDFLLIGFFLMAGLSLITSQNIGLSVYQIIKLAEFVLLFLYIKHNLSYTRSPSGDLGIGLQIKNILKVFIASGVFQALLAICQFFSQSSLGLKHFEAGIFNANIPGVATFFVQGTKFIRAYGTAPHPNVLAIFLLVSIFCLYYLYLTRTPPKKACPTSTGQARMGMRIIQMISLFILMLGLLLTFSRAIILVFIAVSLLFFLIAFLKFQRPSKFRVIGLFLLFVVYCSLFTVLLCPEISARFLTISAKEQAVTLRVYYNDIAVSAIKEKPILGLGLGNFVWYLSNNYQFKEFWLYQPVHNLYLLVAVEIGIIGLIFFLIFIAKILLKGFKGIQEGLGKYKGKQIICFLFLVSCFLFLGLIDHYFWTIQQGRLVFWVVLAIISGLILSGPRSSTNPAPEQSSAWGK